MCYCSFRDDFNLKVLQAFVDLHEFTDLNLVQALRWAFTSFCWFGPRTDCACFVLYV
jgi:hypothetical protein